MNQNFGPQAEGDGPLRTLCTEGIPAGCRYPSPLIQLMTAHDCTKGNSGVAFSVFSLTDLVPFATGLVSWAGFDLNLGRRLEVNGKLEYSLLSVEGVTNNQAITICLPFYGMMTPVGMMMRANTLEGPCSSNPFCLLRETNDKHFVCHNCEKVYHLNCVGNSVSTCGCDSVGDILRR